MNKSLKGVATLASARKEQNRSYWMLVLPGFLVYFAVLAFPTVFSVVLSLTNYNGGKLFGGRVPVEFVGLKWYKRLFVDEYFYLALKNNLWIVFVSVFGQIPLGFFLAYVLYRGIVKNTDFFQTMIYLPCVISTVVIGILWKSFFAPYGAYPELVRLFNPSFEYGVSNHPILPVLFVILWMYTGTYLIIFMANLQKIDSSIIEAAKIDGASEGQSLRYIILPALSGIIVTSCIFAISGSLKSFDLIYVMTGGGPANRTSVLSVYMFDKAFQGAPNYPLANAISTVMVIISFMLIGLTKWAEKRFGGKE
ncbi:sugar ABC transporter permease [uncultured Sphaerochaeta sp.]|uniref:carbohydrate ABC transporter permease n=1 Tax=uncultured Sphaerochaeta sp. TaxID=886478 RepID=UPI002A0A90D7|nr:sugar ABC transporter permease [uncultured Sphaerochaeta sp.]